MQELKHELLAKLLEKIFGYVTSLSVIRIAFFLCQDVFIIIILIEITSPFLREWMF